MDITNSTTKKDLGGEESLGRDGGQSKESVEGLLHCEGGRQVTGRILAGNPRHMVLLER